MFKYKMTLEEKTELFNLFIEMLEESEKLSDEAKSNEELIYECEDMASKPTYLNIFLKNAELMREKMSKFDMVYRKVNDAYYKPGLIYMSFHTRLTHLPIDKMREIIREENNEKYIKSQQKLF